MEPIYLRAGARVCHPPPVFAANRTRVASRASPRGNWIRLKEISARDYRRSPPERGRMMEFESCSLKRRSTADVWMRGGGGAGFEGGNEMSCRKWLCNNCSGNTSVPFRSARTCGACPHCVDRPSVSCRRCPRTRGHWSQQVTPPSHQFTQGQLFTLSHSHLRPIECFQSAPMCSRERRLRRTTHTEKQRNPGSVKESIFKLTAS